MEIIPAIMVKDHQELHDLAERVCNIVPLVHVDVMDGIFVPKKSWPFAPQGGYVSEFTDIIAEKSAMPFWQELDYELDLLVKRPDQAIDDWIASGARRLIFHIESFIKSGQAEDEGLGILAGFFSDLRQRFPKGVDDSIANLEIGLALNTDTSPRLIYPFIEHIDFVQCMGINKIGFQGQPLDERVFDQISSIRDKYSDIIISVDGAVNIESAPLLSAAGADRFVAGSAVFGSSNVVEAIDELYDAVRGKSVKKNDKIEH